MSGEIPKGQHTGPESVLEQEAELVSKLIRAYRNGDTETGHALLVQLGRACFIQGKAAATLAHLEAHGFPSSDSAPEPDAVILE